jgi:AraC-like DNA-binding protein
MYFSNLVNDSNKLKIKDLVHSIIIIPFVFFFIIKNHLTKEEFIIGNKTLLIAAIVWNIGYAIASYKLIKEKVWKRNSAILIINQQNKIIKQWTQILYSVFVLLLFRFLICLLLTKNEHWYINHNDYMWVSGLILIGLYIKILYSPDFLYGYEEFQNKIKEYKKHNIVFNNIWIMDASKLVTNVQDTVLKEKIASQIENYILAIEYQAVSTNLFFTKNLQIEDVAHKLTTPKSHLLYIFKYHAAISFADFKKIIRIQKIILLVEEGYLKNNTMESLAAATGFSSYSSFFKSFKSIAGMSPQEYCSKMN